MPLIQITLVEGRDAETIKRCIKHVARTVHESLNAPMSSIRVLVHQLPANQWAVGDRMRDEIDAESGDGSTSQ
jgi:4-oxalocrotonate tautomerase